MSKEQIETMVQDSIKWNKIEKPNTIQPGYSLFLFDGSKLSTDDFKMSKGVSNFERAVNFVGDLGKGKYAIQKQVLWVFQAYTPMVRICKLKKVSDSAEMFSVPL